MQESRHNKKLSLNMAFSQVQVFLLGLSGDSRCSLEIGLGLWPLLVLQMFLGQYTTTKVLKSD